MQNWASCGQPSAASYLLKGLGLKLLGSFKTGCACLCTCVCDGLEPAEAVVRGSLGCKVFVMGINPEYLFKNYNISY